MWHNLGPQCCRIRPSHELTVNMAFSVLLWMLKVEAGSDGYLGPGNSHLFITFTGALGSFFANCWAALQSQCVPLVLAGLITDPLVTNICNNCESAICEILPHCICAKSPHPYWRSGTEGGGEREGVWGWRVGNESAHTIFLKNTSCLFLFLSCASIWFILCGGKHLCFKFNAKPDEKRKSLMTIHFEWQMLTKCLWIFTAFNFFCPVISWSACRTTDVPQTV